MAITLQQTDIAPSCAAAPFCSGRVLTATPQDAQAQQGGTAGTVIQNIDVGNNDVNTAVYTYECVIPSGYDGAAGTWTINVNVSVGNSNLNFTEVYVCRVNSSCVSQETLASATGLAVSASAGSKQFTPNQASAATFAAGDTAQVVLIMTHVAGHGGQSFSITPSQTIEAPGSVSTPPITVNANPGITTIAGQTATITVAQPVITAANVGIISIAGQVANASTPTVVATTTGVIPIAGQIATITISSPVTVSANVGLIGIAGQSASVSTTGITFEIWDGANWINIGVNNLIFSGSNIGLTAKVNAGEFQDGTFVGTGTPGTEVEQGNNVKYISDTEMQVNGGATENINDTNLSQNECTLRLKFTHGVNVTVPTVRLYCYDGTTGTALAPYIDVYAFERGVSATQWTKINDASALEGGDNLGEVLTLSDRLTPATEHIWYLAVSVSPEVEGALSNLEFGFALEYSE